MKNLTSPLLHLNPLCFVSFLARLMLKIPRQELKLAIETPGIEPDSKAGPCTVPATHSDDLVVTGTIGWLIVVNSG